MPCTKCKDGKYKWGESGECKYETKEACEKANHKYNKMEKPTPLGKTTEQYEKELKEFNLNKIRKVELGLADDMEQVAQQLFGLSKNAEMLIKNGNGTMKDIRNTVKGKQSELNSQINNMISLGGDMRKGQSNARDLAGKAESAAKNIGVPVKNIPGYNNMEDEAKDSDDVIESLRTVANEMSAYLGLLKAL
jgi:predicted molibdopterin-dependent oxidoreductase YjgC